VELLKDIGAFAGLAAFFGLAVLALLSFAQGRDIRRLREWAGSAPERDSERKESTSAAAAERAEELRRLEESRTAEHETANLREERRKRREAGLPELTRSERLRETFKGTRSHLAEPRYLIALFAVFVIVAGGAAYLVTQGSDDAGGTDSGNNGVAKVRPSEIEVTVLNGTAVPGLAATYGDMVESKGFELGAVTNSSSSFVDSVVMYQPGKAREAHRVADALEIAQVRAMTSDISSVSGGAPVSVIVGEDNATTAG
jgi:LytR cell envelope-related transcriptional attenuator